MTPGISVVIPVRNGMPFLPATLDSVRNQSRRADQIVVVENGSTDGTLEFLRAQSDIELVVQRNLVGAPQNWSTAVSSARFQYLKILCADDPLLPHCLSRQSMILSDHPACVMTAGRRRIIRPDGRVIREAHGLSGLRGEVPGLMALQRAATFGNNLFGEVSAVLFRTESVQSELPWPDQAGYATDLAMYIKLLQSCAVYCDREVVCEFRVSTTAWSFKARNSQAEDVVRLFRESDSLGLLERNILQKISGRLFAGLRQLARGLVYSRRRY